MNSSTPSSVPSAPRRLPCIARYVMGIPLIVFGLNMFLNFIPQPKTEMAPGAAAFAGALMNTGYMMQLIGVTFLVSGLMLVTNRFVPLALAFLAPFFVNSLMFHIVLEHTGLPMAAIFIAFEVYLAWAYRGAYRTMLAARVSPT